MASFHILTSSPLQNFTNTTFLMSSSPLPSHSEMFKRAPTMRSGSRAAPIPMTANATFTSASTLLQNARTIESIQRFRALADLDEEVEKPAAKPKVRKLRAKKGIGSDETPEKKPAQITKKKTDPKPADETALKEKAIRKSRAKKDDSKTQPKLAKARVTKSGTNGTNGTKKKALASDMAAASDSRTPFKVPAADPFSETPLDTLPSKSKPHAPDTSFSSLMNNFGSKNGESSRQERAMTDDASNLTGTKKRKSPEIKERATVKPKPPRKKAKTITDQATAAYVTDVPEVEIPKRPGAITDFFGYKPKDNDAAADGPSVPKSKPIQFKPGDKRRPILLSPESAMKDINKQDIIFGTSSQLAREDSPTLLRDLQQAMRESNSADDCLFTDLSINSNTSASTSLRIRSRVGRNNLWGASSRDQSGELMNVEVVDLSKTPVAKVMSKPAHLSTDEHATEPIRFPAVTLDIPDPKSILAPSIVEKPSIVAKKNPITHTETQKARPATQKHKSLKKRSKKQAIPTERPDYSTYTDEQLSKAVDAFGFKPVKKRNAMLEVLDKCWEGRSKAKLSDEVANGGSSNKITMKPSEQPGPPVVAPVQTDPIKKPRGRPKKVVDTVPSLPTTKKSLSKPTTQIIKADSDSEDIPLSLRRTPQKTQKTKNRPEEISDSDTALTPPPPRGKGSKKKVALPLKSIETESKDTEAESQAELFIHITKAVKAAPPSKSSSDPNWYEKMLLYDPIVLEDLTIWLNTGGLERVGWDGEVCPSEVKIWCESKSVCCLMRENLRGGARSRY